MKNAHVIILFDDDDENVKETKENLNLRQLDFSGFALSIVPVKQSRRTPYFYYELMIR